MRETDQDRGKGYQWLAIYQIPIGRGGRSKRSIRGDSLSDSTLEASSRTWIRQEVALKYNDEKSSKIELHCKSLYMRKLKDRNDKTDGAEIAKRFSGLKSDDRTLEMQT